VSYANAVEGLNAAIATVTDVKAVLDHEPTSVQTSPLVYSILDGVDRQVTGLTVRVTYRTLHRLCIRWQDSEASEAVVQALVDAIPEAVEADPKLGGRLRPGDAQISRGDAGWAQIGNTTCRIIDFYSEVVEISGCRGLGG
jgi:hypothetical protein